MAPIRTRPLGSTGIDVPELGLGAMDTPTSTERVVTITAALDAGIRFIDTARDYAGSEFLIGEVLRERGHDGLVLASNTFARTASGAQWDVDRSLRAMGVPAIALYQLHDVRTPADWEAAMAEGGALEGLQVARYRGLVGHIGISTHTLDIAREAILSGEFATIMLEYSAFYPDSAPLIELAGERGVGVIAMRPVGGSGRTSIMRQTIERGAAGILTPANLLRYVLSNPAVSVAIPGARYPSRVFENAATVRAFEPMSESERRALESAAAAFYEG
ncbi:MAG: aldo/keto reductase [Dehalococcoidia bacterium]